ncbi:MAG: response regulator [Pseudomonadota bacterium]
MKLLIVDDSLAHRKRLIRALRETGLEFSAIFEASDGLEALALVSKNRPDLIILDINMPKLDGMKFLVTLRRTYSSAQVKVIVLTAQGGKTTEEAAQRAGADGFFTKPYVAEDLAKKASELLGVAP